MFELNDTAFGICILLYAFLFLATYLCSKNRSQNSNVVEIEEKRKSPISWVYLWVMHVFACSALTILIRSFHYFWISFRERVFGTLQLCLLSLLLSYVPFACFYFVRVWFPYAFFPERYPHWKEIRELTCQHPKRATFFLFLYRSHVLWYGVFTFIFSFVSTFCSFKSIPAHLAINPTYYERLDSYYNSFLSFIWLFCFCMLIDATALRLNFKKQSWWAAWMFFIFPAVYFIFKELYFTISKALKKRSSKSKAFVEHSVDLEAQPGQEAPQNELFSEEAQNRRDSSDTSRRSSEPVHEFPEALIEPEVIVRPIIPEYLICDPPENIQISPIKEGSPRKNSQERVNEPLTSSNARDIIASGGEQPFENNASQK